MRIATVSDNAISTCICLQLLVESQYHHHSPLLQALRQVDDGDVRKGVSNGGVLREPARQIDEALRYDRPRRFVRQRTNDVVPALFYELATSISVADMHDMVGDPQPSPRFFA